MDSGISYKKGYDNPLLFLVMRAGGPWTSGEIIFEKMSSGSGSYDELREQK